MATSLLLLRHQLRNVILNVKIRQDNFIFFSSVVAKDLNITKNVAHVIEDDEEVLEYPPVKPRYPPGNWGDMEPSYAWLWQKTIDDLIQIPDVKGRQDLITSKEMSHLNILPHNDHPDHLEFVKYATKTTLLPWSECPLLLQQANRSQSSKPPSIDDNDSNTNSKNMVSGQLMKNMKSIIVDQLLIEQEAVERERLHSRKHSPFFTERQSGLVMRSIFDTVITNLSGQASHLRTCQYDEDVIVRAVWDRHGIERQRRHRLSNENHFKMDKVLDHRLLSSCTFNGMVRSHLPLPQLHPRDSGLSTESEKPSLKYKYLSHGVTKIAAHKSKSILAGHALGDPCEYGHVGFLLTNRQRGLDEAFGHKIAQECRLARGLSSTFTWLAAQAYNQGFSGFIDLTYPLTSQTVLSDGQNFSFIACQLNTLELWKSDSANDMVNLCWYTDEMPLYDCIENGQVKGFNDDVFEMLLKVLMLEPADRGYDMKPTISDKEINLHRKHDFIPGKVEEVVEKEEEQYIV